LGGAELQRTVPFIVVGRAGFASPDAQVAPVALPAVSSRQVRAALAAGGDVRGLVPRAVLDYISTHNLYKAGEEFA
jgi:nicotinic acid mononucleotide adenylyltransferase